MPIKEFVRGINLILQQIVARQGELCFESFRVFRLLQSSQKGEGKEVEPYLCGVAIDLVN
jgi:hypothetical protein